MLRNVRYIILILVAVPMWQGCTGALQSSWRDFNAYFNTYYNAKTSFERGVELQEQQEITINPERPIRIHPTPRRAGLSDFEHASQKSADVIRFHPRSRWVDNSIMMIGKSYFYMQQFFSADQKFMELLATTQDPSLRQEAILWRGRAALELENYVEGINYTQSRLFSTEFEWDRRIEADLRLVIAQLLVARGEYEEAVEFIAEALPDIRSRQLEMRAYFLHGQLLESLERYDEAFEAYNRATHQSNPSYDLIYHAERKMGIVARKRGDLEWAHNHFVSMSRDDRHFSYIASIEYEIARSLQDMGSYTAARQKYEQILRRRTQPAPRETQAQIYYGMAEIYRDFYMDFNLTAAYFDSSATQGTNLEQLPVNFDAGLMSRSYGEYSRLQNEVHRLDSLLWLSELSEAAFDSVINVVRERKIAEIERQQREQRRQQMVTIADMEEVGTQADEDTDNGFLNYKNPQLMMQNRQAFQALWAARPLVDDWRRMEAVRVNIVRQLEEEGEEIEDVDQAIEKAVAPRQQMVEIDISDIPFSEEQQMETRRMIASHEYEIGNVFFTFLAMPDSAARYYRNVMRRFPDSELAPQAIYSLSELYQSSGDSTQALQYAMQLVDFYPNTIYAERMADRYDFDLVREAYVMSREDSIALQYQEIITLGLSDDRAGKLRNFAEKYPDDPQAAQALYRSVLDYIEVAREDEQYAYRINDLSTTRYIWRQEQDEFEVFRDSVRALLADSAYMAVTAELDAARGANDSEPVSLNGLQDDAPAVDPEDIPEETQDVAPDDIPEDAPDYTPGDSREDTPVQIPEEEQEGRERVDRPSDDMESEVHSPEDSLQRITYRSHLQNIVDKTMEEPDFSEWFPYEGAMWDSARVALLTLRNNYPDFPRSRIVNELAEEIDVDRVRALLVDTEKIYDCNELDERPDIEGGLDAFIQDSGFHQVIEEFETSGTVVIHVLIDKDGLPSEIHTEGEDDELGIMEALLQAVEGHMRFSTPRLTGVAVQAQCEYTIEFSYENQD